MLQNEENHHICIQLTTRTKRNVTCLYLEVTRAIFTFRYCSSRNHVTLRRIQSSIVIEVELEKIEVDIISRTIAHIR